MLPGRRHHPGCLRPDCRTTQRQAAAHAKEETMRILAIGLIALGAVTASIPRAQSQTTARPTLANEADYLRAMKELSNWGRWGKDDEIGAANLITPAKRKQATALVTEGVAV